MRARCELCGGRLYADESQLQHEFSGRCSAHQRFGTPLDEIVLPVGSSYHSAGAAEHRRRAARPAGPPRATRNRKPPEHGTPSRYASSKWKCRCDACTEANNRYKREHNAANREARRAYNREWMRQHRLTSTP